MSPIEILLATHNSALYLVETLESVYQQDYTGWRLVLRDGGSTDDTLNIIQESVGRYPDKIHLLPSEGQSAAGENFSKLLLESSSPYVMFCDHDDVWLPAKTSKTLDVMKNAEQHYGSNMPLLVFTDKRVVDANLKKINNSYFEYQHLQPKRIGLNYLLLQNVPSGCTIMMNRPLVDLCKPIPPQAVMHDHWVGLVAAAFGKIIFLDEPTLLYRQHESNIYGASEYGWGHFYRRHRQGLNTARNRLLQYIVQATAFYDRYAPSLPPPQRQMFEDVAQWSELSWLSRRKLLLKHRILKTGFRRNVGMFLIA